MGPVIGALLPLAVGVAISPIPIIAVILMLLSRRPGATSVGFAAGWVVGIVAATAVFTLLAGVLQGSQDAGDDGPGTVAGVIDVVLGVLLLLVAVRQWGGRPRPGHPAVMPAWMSAIDRFTAVKAAGLGFLLSALNPKNLLMAVAAGNAIGGAALSVGGDITAVAVFTVLAASTVLVPVIGFLAARARVTPWLTSLQHWLTANNAVVMAVLLAVLGFVQLGKGIGALF